MIHEADVDVMLLLILDYYSAVVLRPKNRKPISNFAHFELFSGSMSKIRSVVTTGLRYLHALFYNRKYIIKCPRF